MITICCFAIYFAAVEIIPLNGEELTSDRESKVKLSLLIATIEREWPVGIQRDVASNIVSIILPVRYATDANLELLVFCSSLRQLSLSYNKNLSQPTGSGIMALERAQELRSLTVQCTDELPSEFFDGVRKLRQLNRLTLIKSSPDEAIGYSFLTNLPDLRELVITLPAKFGSNEMLALAKNEQLQSLHIISEQVNEVDCMPLLSSKTLTNLSIDSGRWTIQLIRKSK